MATHGRYTAIPKQCPAICSNMPIAPAATCHKTKAVFHTSAGLPWGKLCFDHLQ